MHQVELTLTLAIPILDEERKLTYFYFHTSFLSLKRLYESLVEPQKVL